MRSKIVAFGLVLLLCVFVSMTSALSNSGGGEWKYYKEITVKENSGRTLNDFQVLVELNSENIDFSKAKSDGSDIRFECEGKELSYWIEEWDAHAKKAKIWVKVPSIPANGEVKIKMYYGNPYATSVSDGDATFEFFDDFEGPSLDTDEWIIFGKPKMTFSNSILDISGSCGAENANGDVLESKKNFNYPLIYEAYYKYDHTPWGNYAGIGLGRYSYPVSTYCAIEVDRSCYDNKGAFIVEDGENRDGCSDWVVNDWAKTKIVWTDKFVSFKRESATCTFTSSIPSQPMPVHLGDSYYNSNEFIQLYVDWLFIRKYASPEPTLTFPAEYPVVHTALTLTKTVSPYSIKQGQKSTVRITVENTGTTTLRDIEVVDEPPVDFDFVSGETSARYGMLKSGESRTFQYLIKSGSAGRFDLGAAKATYADESGNYRTVNSNSAMIDVLAPITAPEIPTGEEKGIPGFDAIFAVAGLLAVAYILRRYRK